MNPLSDDTPTGALALSDGTIFYGRGVGMTGSATGEVCFNTAMTGYQEILTDPSYAGQIVTFTFPHVGNVGTNDEDVESTSEPAQRAAVGCVMRADLTPPANYRSRAHLEQWLRDRKIIGISGVDTRALTRHIRLNGMPKGTIVHDPSGITDLGRAVKQADDWRGLEGADLAEHVSTPTRFSFDGRPWRWSEGYPTSVEANGERPHVVAIDFGIKSNILRLLVEVGFRVTVEQDDVSPDTLTALNPDGIFLSNGPGDPAATAERVGETLKTAIDLGVPIFGICLGHQLLALALGAQTKKMHQGHHGANHPVKDLKTGKVEIVSMNHGFTVDRETLPNHVEETHISLFDGTNCGLRVSDKPIFSVQYHPEASPGPQDSYYLFARFADAVRQRGLST